jgi:hypothetical protein
VLRTRNFTDLDSKELTQENRISRRDKGSLWAIPLRHSGEIVLKGRKSVC